MTLKDFTDITLKVIEKNGVADYLPALALPDTQRIKAIEGIPDHVAHTEAIQKVILRSGFETREFFFGVRSGDGQITTGHYCPGRKTSFMLIREIDSGYVVESIENCSWWRVGFQQGAASGGRTDTASGVLPMD